MSLLRLKHLPKHVKYKTFLEKYTNSKSYAFLTKYFGIGIGNRQFSIPFLLTRIRGYRITYQKSKLLDIPSNFHMLLFFILEHFFEKKTGLWLKKKNLLDFTTKIVAGSFKMYRFKLNLPTNGQRVRTNHKTARRLNYGYLKLYGIVAN